MEPSYQLLTFDSLAIKIWRSLMLGAKLLNFNISSSWLQTFENVLLLGHYMVLSQLKLNLQVYSHNEATWVCLKSETKSLHSIVLTFKKRKEIAVKSWRLQLKVYCITLNRTHFFFFFTMQMSVATAVSHRLHVDANDVTASFVLNHCKVSGSVHVLEANSTTSSVQATHNSSQNIDLIKT